MQEKVLNVMNPANGEFIASVTLLSADGLRAVVDRAVAAKKGWRDTPLYQRAAILQRFCDIFSEKAEEVAALSTREFGKPISQTTAESRNSVNIARAAIERALHLYGDVKTENAPGAENDLIFSKREPLGIAACIIPFNFPVELAIQKIIPALIMGNVVIVKAPSSNPLAVLKVGELLSEAGLPEGAASFVTCGREACTEEIIKSPRIDAVSLTGSTAAGQEVAEHAAATLKTVLLELGGNDALIIFDDADLDAAVEEITFGRLFNNGQTCCASKRIIVDNRIRDALTEKLIRRVSAMKAGDPMDQEVEISALRSEEAAITVEEQIRETIEAGAKLVYGGQRMGAMIIPAILTEVPADAPVARDLEIFGPVIPLIGFDSEEEAVEIANHTMYGLSSGLMTSDMSRAFRVAGQLEAGGVVLNGNGLYRHVDQAFGGFKMSGIGREGVSVSLEEFSQLKTYVIKGAFAKKTDV